MRFAGRRENGLKSQSDEERPIVIEATAHMSGGGVYLNELLPRLGTKMPWERLLVFGAPRSKDSPGQANVTAVELNFPLKNNTVLLAVVKAIWRLLIFPARVFWRRPKAIVSTANFISPLFSFLGIPTVLCVHNLTPFHAPEWYRDSTLGAKLRNRALRRLTIASVRNATKVIAFSEYARDIFTRYTSQNKVEVIYHGSPAAAQTWRGENSKTFLVVAHYFPYKRVEVVVRAIARIIERTGSREIRLVVQGSPCDRRYFELLEEVVRVNHVGDCVTLGSGLATKELHELYASSRALVFPSIGENCPITLLEAMTIGIPIISADCPPLPEICADASEYFREGSVEACSHAIERLCNDVNRCKELSNAGLTRAAPFTWDRCADATAREVRSAAYGTA